MFRLNSHRNIAKLRGGLSSLRNYSLNNRTIVSTSQYQANYNNKENEYGRKWSKIFFASFVAYYGIKNVLAEEKNEGEDENIIIPGVRKNGLKEFTLAEIAKHNNPESKIFVFYKQGVYDITEFVESHPGGQDVIMMAAGGSIEKFWDVFAQHKDQFVYEILESMRVGNLNQKEYEELEEEKKKRKSENPYANEPKRDSRLIVRSQTPFTAETPNEVLANEPVTPTNLHYVRHHFPVPSNLNEENYVLEIRGRGVKGDGIIKLKLEDIKKFKKYEVNNIHER